MSACGYAAEKICTALQSAGSLGIAEAARVHQVHITTLYAWRRRFGGMPPTTIERVRALEADNVRLRNTVRLWSRSCTGYEPTTKMLVGREISDEH